MLIFDMGKNGYSVMSLNEYLDKQIKSLTAAARVLLLPLLLRKSKITIADYKQACTFSPRVLTIQNNKVVSAWPGKLQEQMLTDNFLNMPPLREFKKAGVILKISKDLVEFNVDKLLNIVKNTKLTKLIITASRITLQFKELPSESLDLWENHIHALVASRMLFTGFFMLLLPDGIEINAILEKIGKGKHANLEEISNQLQAITNGNLILITRPELIKPEITETKLSHEQIKELLVELGQILGFKAIDEFETPVGKFDVYWERGTTKIFFEVHIKGELKSALFKLEKVDGIPVIVADAKLRNKILALSKRVKFIPIQLILQLMEVKNSFALIKKFTKYIFQTL